MTGQHGVGSVALATRPLEPRGGDPPTASHTMPTYTVPACPSIMMESPAMGSWQGPAR